MLISPKHKRTIKIAGFLLLQLCIITSCSNDNEVEKEAGIQKELLFTKIDSSSSGVNFINVVKNEKDFNIFRYRNFYNGAGVGIGDINNDGLPDLYLTSNMGRNKLYLNEGNFKFRDISTLSKTEGNRSWSTGVTMVDINHDGFLDIYVSNAGDIEGDDRQNELFINNGDLTFKESAEDYNLNENGFTTHAAFLDYDNDGDLDVYILNNSFIPVSSLGYANKREVRSEDWDLPPVFKGGGDKLLKNNNGKFEDVSEEAGIYGSLIGFGLGVTVGDVNEDLLPDIYVSNDFYERDYLYINQGDGTFKEDIKNRVSHLSLSSMGADMADINNDGLPEIFVTDMLPGDDKRLKETSEFERYDLYKLKEDKDFYHQYMQNTLQLNNGNNTFSEIAFYSGVAETDWSWGALMFDMDNDGYKDIFVSNGINHDLTNQDFMDFFANKILQEMVLTGKKKEFDSILNKMPKTPIPNFAFKNNGNLTFENMSQEWGFQEPSFSNGSAYGDLDNDGDLDLVVNNVNQEVFVYRNNSEKELQHNFLKLKLHGTGKNTFAIGSKVNLYVNDQVLSQELIPTRGFQSSVDYRLTFGLGKNTKVDSLQVIWPNRRVQTISNIETNQILNLHQENASENYIFPERNLQPMLTEIDHSLDAHQENNYVDFDYEGLISQMISKEGPAVAVGDVNSDGNDDLFIGGAKNQPGKIFLQNSTGKFSEVKTAAFEKDLAFEDTDAAFEDFDGDGHLDLAVVAGGNNVHSDKDLYRPRIYFNDGNGNFSASKQQVPSTGNNSAVVAPQDYDMDGDIDLFIGNRSVPGVYGINPAHQILENNGSGIFEDVTEAVAYELKDLGMVTSATWADLTGDDKKELVLVGDWLAPKVFTASKDGLRPMKTGLENLTGAWTAVHAEDLNNDGMQDLILGNRGTNSTYNIEEGQPVKMFVNDFDNNGTIEQISTRSIAGKDVPVHLRRELSGQIASVKKQNLKFSEYATKSVQDLFKPEVLENSLVKNISTFKSMIAYNLGNGDFELVELPAEVQFSSVNAIEIIPSKIGKGKHLLLAGNNFNFKPQFSRLDANQGILLAQNEKGEYKVQPSSVTGLQVQGQVRALEIFSNKKGEQFVYFGINNEKPEIFRINDEKL